MKRFLPVLPALVLLAAACSKQETPAPGSSNLTKVTFSVKSGSHTRTALGSEDDGTIPFLWSTGDKLGLFLTTGGDAVSTAQNIPAAIVTNVLESGPGNNVAYFTTELELSPDTKYGVEIYYPYHSWAASGNRLGGTILKRQLQKGKDITAHLGISGSFATASASLDTPSEFGEEYYHRLPFLLSHKTSYALFNVSAADAAAAGYVLRSIVLTAPEGKLIAGDVSYDRASREFTLAGNGSNEITLDIPSGAALSTSGGTQACMVVFPAELSGQTVTIKYLLEKSDGSGVRTATHVKTLSTASVAFEAGSVHRFSEAIPSSSGAGWTISDGTVDLSASGTANCYLIQAAGAYSFNATVIGNGAAGILTPISESLFHTADPSISPASAELLWQTSPGLITGVSLEAGRITFNKPDDTKGNALIAAKDASGNILWSWHIWCTDPGNLQAYVTPYNTYMAMDRHLGALLGRTAYISDNSDENKLLRLACFGLYYQWGRKDPFPYGADLVTSGTRTFITIYDANGDEIPVKNETSKRPFDVVATSATVGTHEYAAAHPTTFILNNDPTDSSDDWYNKYGSGAERDKRGYGFWGNPYGHLYASADAVKPVKTIYDPCPPGYMVPPVDFFEALTARYYYYTGNQVIYDGGTGYSWYQRQGMLRSITGEIYYGNSNGYYWTSGTTSETNAKISTMYMTQKGSGWVKKSLVQRAHGLVIRCIQEL